MKDGFNCKEGVTMNSINRICNKDIKTAVGLMSGTSLDGVDAALLEIKGSGFETSINLLGFDTVPYSKEVKKKILNLCSPETGRVDDICTMNVYLGELMADAALHIIKKCGKNPVDVDFISSHGQTIYHMPKMHSTLQIGELAVIAAKTGCVTIGDFRPSDMANGGQGAPLVPFVDYLLFRDEKIGRILLNIGGISNISVIGRNANPEDIIAFDTGPGNMLVDAIVRIGTDDKLSFDDGGNMAKKGKVNKEWLDELLRNDDYIDIKPPKSTGRERYTMNVAKKLWSYGISKGMSLYDIAATVTAYTACAIAYNIKKFVDPIYETDEIIVGGGGVHNSEMMNMLQSNVKQKVLPVDNFNMSSDAKEAIAFAILGNEFLNENYNNLPSATGAKRKVVMGKLVLP